jgi:hypothetical protein
MYFLDIIETCPKKSNRRIALNLHVQLILAPFGISLAQSNSGYVDYQRLPLLFFLLNQPIQWSACLIIGSGYPQLSPVCHLRCDYLTFSIVLGISIELLLVDLIRRIKVFTLFSESPGIIIYLDYSCYRIHSSSSTAIL